MIPLGVDLCVRNTHVIVYVGFITFRGKITSGRVKDREEASFSRNLRIQPPVTDRYSHRYGPSLPTGIVIGTAPVTDRYSHRYSPPPPLPTGIVIDTAPRYRQV